MSLCTTHAGAVWVWHHLESIPEDDESASLQALHETANQMSIAGVFALPADQSLQRWSAYRCYGFQRRTHYFWYYHPERGIATLALGAHYSHMPLQAIGRSVYWWSSGRHRGNESGWHGTWWLEFVLRHDGPSEEAYRFCLQLTIVWNCLGTRGRNTTTRWLQDPWSPGTFFEIAHTSADGRTRYRRGPVMHHSQSQSAFPPAQVG